VKYPRSYVEERWGPIEINERSPKELLEYRKKQRTTVMKRKITQFRNTIIKYEEAQKTVLVPYFDNPQYLRTIAKLKEYELKLKQIEENI